ncbi:MAG TPA: RNA-directed DNA polymerase [Nocardioidaceae bacterium]|nr:RNA-directed DNA polymerase [Nocardioidaceae bacterium]
MTAKSPISLSRPVKRRSIRSLAPLEDLSQQPGVAITRMPGGRVTLRTDISQFYPSIYTHAVDWAVRGKAVAKKSRRVKVLGTQLDARLRESRDGQTVGISIGPDTSWLISELILARVDERMCRLHPRLVTHGFRVVDDMTYYASSIGEAHDVLANYQQVLAEYELALNPTKVSIVDGLESPHSAWVSRLRASRYRDDRDALLASDLIDLFTLAFELRKTHPTQGVLSYAIQMCDPFPGGSQSWPVYRDLVLASLSQEPSTLRHVYQVLTFAKGHGLDVKDDRLVQVLNEAGAHHARYGHGYEVSWILTTLRELALPLDVATARLVAEMEDNASLVLLADMLLGDPGLYSSVDFSAAVRRGARPGALSTSDWLLAYELRRRKWCAPSKWDGIVQWQELHKAGVDFLLSRSASSARRRLRRRRPTFIAGWSYTN